MPRPYPPSPILPPPVPVPFPIGDREKADLARVLKLDGLQPELCDAISHAIGCYQATRDGSNDTTVANTLAGLGELTKPGWAYRKAVQRFADERSGVDYTTHQMLQPLAKAVLQDEPGSREALAQAAAKREADGGATRAQTRCPSDQVSALFLRYSTPDLQSVRLSRATGQPRRWLASVSEVRHGGVHDCRHRPCRL